ncbi:membrane-spanning 4-domains subfamily A member 12 [Anolis carolinensis]|uniref:membrane-spanning 4-domains subfamily A member 12 n=1 Tax=Anolis carolinensis TaxID=28377 RepID=UPI0002C89399|nr:PREDICTED: membrane-spanning 4-domains subfamily A member 12 [Anolis carolinensis]|eukprot:XP_008114045.1 PREDICTED: membrane-spanning 4-domains subfamily A member 12 [Anolis carolinensis]
MSSTVTDCGNVRIITQVIPQTGPQSAEAPPVTMLGSTSSQIISPEMKQFKNIQPKALGAVLIVLGATQISFGIVLTVVQHNSESLTVKSGIYFWIGILLLFSGSLLVEMEKREHVWLVKAAIIANFLVILSAVIATVLHATEIAQEKKISNICDAYGYCHSKTNLAYGLNVIFIILSFLEISIAVTAVVTGFRATRQEVYQWMKL